MTEKPTLIFDGDCGFCRHWINRWQRAAGGAIEMIPYQDPDVPKRFPKISRADCAKAVHFIEPDGRISSAAEAVFRARSYKNKRSLLLRMYLNLPGFAFATELSYRIVSRNRMFFSRITKMLGM